MDRERRSYLAETYGWTEPQVDVIRNAICVSASDEELEFFLATAKRLGLDPFARQVWFVKRRQTIEDAYGNRNQVEVGKPETSIDGFRTIAERSGEYAGQDPIMWCGPDGKWLDVWLKNTPPSAARASIRRKGIDQPFVAVSVFAEHAPMYRRGNDMVLSAMWQKMPAGQIAKCAEALAFRRAFPRDLSGIETDDETQHLAADAAATFTAPAAVAAPQSAALPPAAKERVIEAVAKSRTAPATVPVPREQPPATEPAPAPDLGTPVESDDPDLANRIADINESIGLATCLDDLRALAAKHDQKSPEMIATKNAFVARWRVHAEAERKGPKKK